MILINGCATPATPARWNLQFDDNAPLPNLSLVRRVVPRVGTEYRERYFFRGKYASVTSESRFGDPDEEANLGCIYVGLKEALPGIDIVPTGTFWEQVGATHDVIELPQLFIGPLSDRLRGLQADVIVIAYHVRIDLENAWGETLVEGVFSDTDEETAAIIVVDLQRKSIIHRSKITFEDSYLFYHVLIIPILWTYTSDPPDICKTVAYQAGMAIAEAMPGRKIRALAVVAGEDPYEATSR